MIAWMLGAFAGPTALAGFAVCLRRGQRWHRCLTRDQIAESEVRADLERRKNKNHPIPDHPRPGRLPAPGTAAMASPAPGSADLVNRRRLEKSVAWSGCERLRCLWYRLRLTVADMNYASKRLVELQTPWIADPQWHMKTNPPPRAEPTGAPSLDPDDHPSH